MHSSQQPLTMDRDPPGCCDLVLVNNSLQNQFQIHCLESWLSVSFYRPNSCYSPSPGVFLSTSPWEEKPCRPAGTCHVVSGRDEQMKICLSLLLLWHTPFVTHFNAFLLTTILFSLKNLFSSHSSRSNSNVTSFRRLP